MLADVIRRARLAAPCLDAGDPLQDALLRGDDPAPTLPRFGWVRNCTNVAWMDGWGTTLDPSLDALIDRLADLVMER